jgi:hypothetical protein
MIVKEHEEPLMQLVVICKLGPSAPEVHLTVPIIVHLHFIWSSSSRLFAEDRFSELAPVHELGKFQWNTLLLTALRRRIGIARSSAGTWGNGSRCLGLVLTSQGAARALLCRCR